MEATPRTNVELANPHRQTAIVASTMYRNWYHGDPRSMGDTDKIRGDLALATVTNAVNRGYRVVIVDSPSSSAEFQEELARSGATIVPRQSDKRSPGRRQGYEAASLLDDVKVICYTEAEKVGLIDDLDELAAPILNDKADIVVPRRDQKLFEETYPNYMFNSEQEGLAQYNGILRKAGLLQGSDQDLDLYFGPKLFRNSPQVKELFMAAYEYKGTRHGARRRIDAEELSDATFYPVVAALYRGLHEPGFRVHGVTTNFRYPELQRVNEEAPNEGKLAEFLEKRKQQRISLTLELIQFIRYLMNSPKGDLIQITS